VTTPALAHSKSHHLRITVKYSTQLWPAVRLSSRSCLTTAGVCCQVHQELWKQALRTTRYHLPSLSQLLENCWVGSAGTLIGLQELPANVVLTARLNQAPSASSVNHMFPFFLPPKCNRLLYGIWQLLDTESFSSVADVQNSGYFTPQLPKSFCEHLYAWNLWGL
jgi:hypothetical protein